jgi:hypothetical protein
MTFTWWSTDRSGIKFPGSACYQLVDVVRYNNEILFGRRQDYVQKLQNTFPGTGSHAFKFFSFAQDHSYI